MGWTGLLGFLLLGGPALSALGDSAPWQPESGFRWRPLPAPHGTTGFVRLGAEASGLRFTNTLDEWSGAANRVLYNGAGVAAGDVDGDGRPDLFFCHLGGTNALFRNLGNARFENVTASAGLGHPLPQTRGATFADLDGDRDLDLLISVNNRGVLIFLNDGQGHFRENPMAAGTGGRPGSTTLALADVDGNGTLDLYLANYRNEDIRDRGRVNMTMVNGRPILRGSETNRFLILAGRLEEAGQPDQLFLNDGHGRFTAVPWTGGVFLDESGRPLTEPPMDWGLTATFRDVNGDGAPDLYVCNDYWTPDRFWLNDGHGRFRAMDRLALRKTSASSMSVDFADLDRDGDLDFFVVDMLSRYPAMRKRQLLAQMPRASPIGVLDDRPQVMRNTLYLNRGDTTFAEVAFQTGLEASDWSWSPVFLDVDLDGYEDLVIGAGHFRDVQDFDAEREIQSRQRNWSGFANDAERQRAFTRELMEHYRLYPLLPMPIGAFRNQGDGHFTEVTPAWGLDHPGIHQGLALADFDGNGTLDLAVNSLNSEASLFLLEGPAERVAVRLRGKAPNTAGIGARLTLLNGAVPRQTTELIGGGRYQSGSDPVAVFAAGPNPGPMTLEVIWRSGATSLVTEVRSRRLYEIDEAAAPPPPTTSPARQPPPELWFEEVTDRLAHRHHESDFDDFQRQPLLPMKLSQGGPGVAWFDVDADGDDDLLVGSGRGGRLAVFRGDGHGRFESESIADGPAGLPDDLAGIVGWRDPAGPPAALVALTGYEVDAAGGIFRQDLGKAASERRPLPGGVKHAGAIAVGDPGDGRLALFVAGGVLPGQYPRGAPSRLYRWQDGQWRLDARTGVLLENLGMVNGAVWSDLDGDGGAELILACEWGPIRVFRSRAGALAEITDQLGLGPFTGWWRGVTTGDLNGDGRPDIVASNWGWNSPYHAETNRPLTVVFGELAQPGVMEVIETEYVGSALAPRRQFKVLANSMPFLLERFPTQKAYSEATLEQVLGDRAVLGRRVAATTLASMAFLSGAQGFRPAVLPAEAQRAPGFGVCVADLDGDGHEDVFLAQNFFPSNPEDGRLDAGLGCWLRGDGTGALDPVPAARSGIRIHGDQRGAALADFDRDGRVDLVVAQNGAATVLYRNRAAKPGWRVRLEGPPGNPLGYGAVLRLRFGDRLGPAREIHGGSGYWSQNSPVQVLSSSQTPSGLSVRWPGGRVTEVELPTGSRELTVKAAN